MIEKPSVLVIGISFAGSLRFKSKVICELDHPKVDTSQMPTKNKSQAMLSKEGLKLPTTLPLHKNSNILMRVEDNIFIF